MTWFSRSANSKNNLNSQQIEQRSHQPLGLDKNLPEDSDILHTLDKITDGKELHLKELTVDDIAKTNKSVASFVEQNPKKDFIIDGEKYLNESIICTSNAHGEKTCLKLKYSSIELFKQMQKMDYFCSLPNDINATYFECRKIE